MKFFICLILAVLFSSSALADPLQWANGAWGIDVGNIPEGLSADEIDTYRNCKSTPVLITVDRDTMRYTAVHTGENNFISASPVLNATDTYLSLRYDDEDRVMENGNLHKWHMVFVSPDKFYWVLGEEPTKEAREGIIAIARIRCQTLVG